MCGLASVPRSHGCTGAQPDAQTLAATNSATEESSIIFITHHYYYIGDFI